MYCGPRYAVFSYCCVLSVADSWVTLTSEADARIRLYRQWLDQKLASIHQDINLGIRVIFIQMYKLTLPFFIVSTGTTFWQQV